MQDDTVRILSPQYPHDQLTALREAVGLEEPLQQDFGPSRGPCRAEDLLRLRELWDENPDSRLAAYSAHVPGAFLADWLFHRAVTPLKSPEANVFTLRSGRALKGCASWRPLKWDTEQFGFLAGRLDTLLAAGAYAESLEAKLKVLSALLEDCREHQVHHLTARVDAGDLSSIHALEQAGFQWIDAIQTLALEISSSLALPRTDGFELREFRRTDLGDVLAIARSVYVYDRFHADPSLSTATADRVNANWLRNACAGHGADHVVIAADNRGVIGYVTCKLENDLRAGGDGLLGTIVMIATAGRARGRGVAMAATLAAVRWFAERRVKIVEVGTQLRNTPAARVYQKCHFRQVAASLTFTRRFK